jgi:hypothetical protein
VVEYELKLADKFLLGILSRVHVVQMEPVSIFDLVTKEWHVNRWKYPLCDIVDEPKAFIARNVMVDETYMRISL